MGGIFIAKRINDTIHRMVLTTDFGNKLLDFEILNNFVISQNHKQKRGIGLVNTKKRLKLIYRNNFSLKQKTKLNFYITRLQIPTHNED